ncbi:MAG TPA: BatD family protein, partial [Verrucomicrobiales bacterium]|nr:BatD family protein [Verrucomicrobiales bacterium]
MKILPLTTLGLLLAMLPLAASAQQAPPPVPPATPPPSAVPAAPPVAPPAVPGTEKTDTSLEVLVSPSTVAVGEQAMMTVRVPDGRNLEKYPPLIETSGLSIQFAGRSARPYRAGGKTFNNMELQYYVEALEPGTYTIPEQKFIIDGKQYTSRPVQVVVSDGPPIEDALKPQAQLAVGKTEMWEGEEVPVVVSVLLHRAIQITSSPFPVIKTDGIAVSRFDRSARIDQAEINGQLWNSWQMPSSMVALKSGPIALGPADVKLEVLVPTGSTRPDIYGSYSTARRTLKVKSNAINIRVKPLPSDGKPDGFAGAVGNFQLSAQTEQQSTGPQAVPLGDPIAFELMVTGVGNFDAVTAPSLEKAEGLRAYKPKVSLENRGLGTEQGQKGFTQIIFTEKPGPIAVVFTLPYFDPAAGKYVTAKSEPVQFIVTGDPVAVAAASVATAAETKDFSGVAKADVPREDLQDILPNPVQGSRWFPMTTATVQVSPWMLHGIPAILLALILSTGTVKRLRAWQIANRPPPNAPRECSLIARDLHRSNLSLLQ